MYLIASWGSSGAGKTTVAMALASAFAAKRKDVLILSSDTRTPLLPVLLPTVKGVDGGNSIGPLLGAASIAESALKDRILPHPHSRHIFCMGLAAGETMAITYAPPTRDGAVNLLHLLRQASFDYVIVDCDAYPLYDQTTLAALEMAQTGLMLLTPDVKGFEFMRAQLGWLANSDVFHFDRFLKLASPVFPHTPRADANTLFGGFDAELPFSPRVAEKMLAGELLTGLDDRAGILFEHRLKALVERIEREAAGNGE